MACFGLVNLTVARTISAVRKGDRMKKATGSKKGQEAFKVLQIWRLEGAPEEVTQYEANKLTGGLVGLPFSYKGWERTKPIRLIEVAVKYVNKGGSVKDYEALKKGETNEK